MQTRKEWCSSSHLSCADLLRDLQFVCKMTPPAVVKREISIVSRWTLQQFHITATMSKK